MKRWRALGGVPEASRAARVSVFVAAAAANLGLAVIAGASLTAIFCLAMVGVGHWFSWRGRHRPRRWSGQALLTALVLVCVAYLFVDLFLGTFGGALPQAKFALLMQAVTAFDLKSRRNLFSHLWHSLVILYVAAIFAWDVSFLVFVLAWSAGMFAFLFFTRRPVRWGTAHGERIPPAVRRRPSAILLGAWLVIAVGIFIALPRLAGRPLAVPLLVSIPLQESSAAEVLPSALPLVGANPGTAPEGAINLRVRGRLGEQVMFRVRAPAWSYWRQYVLEQYQGQSWQRLGHPARALSPVATNIQVEDEPSMAAATLPQTFYIDRQMSVDVPLSYPVREIYFPARQLTLVDTGSVRAPFALRRGVSYAAVSQVRDLSAARLRTAGPLPGDADPRTLVLPTTIPLRVGQLAHRLAAGRATEFDRVTAIADHLRTTYRYTLDTPRLPSGADAVDQFLFVDRAGFCEQFASALAVMLRAEGIPARLVVGYASGQHDTLTGTFTVRARDAHAWVEVYFPTIGWVPFDASPGFVGEPAAQAPVRWFLSDFSGQVPLIGFAASPRGLAVGAPLVLLLVLGVALARRPASLPTRNLRVYARAQRLLALTRLPTRRGAQTPSEHLAALSLRAPGVARVLAQTTRAVEAEAYAGRGLKASGTWALALALLQFRLLSRRAAQ